MDEFCQGAPDELFHYTNTEGLIGILANKGELWATDARCMNDTNELSLGACLLRQAIKAEAKHPAHALLSRLLRHPAYVSTRVVVTSFSAERDLLSQWRAYADDGSGFALGFRSAELSKVQLYLVNDVPEYKDIPCKYLVKVQYDEHIQRSHASRLVEGILNTLSKVTERPFDDFDDQIVATALGMVLLTFAAACKNVGFEEEVEHRLALLAVQDPLLPSGTEPYLTMPMCHFRAGRYGVTPYIKLRFASDTLTQALSRIVTGPKVMVSDTEQKLRLLLANAKVNCWSEFPIDSARATYR